MQSLTAGITKADTGIDGIVLEHPRPDLCAQEPERESSFSWHATFPPGTFVPPHIHPTQDEFIYMFEGRFDLVLDGQDFVATAGDLIRLPMGIPHGIFNKSDQPMKCFFWVYADAQALRPVLGDPQHEGADARRGRGALRQARSGVPAAASLSALSETEARLRRLRRPVDLLAGRSPPSPHSRARSPCAART